MDTQIAMAAELGTVPGGKAKLLRLAMISLALAALSVGTGVVID